MLQYNLYIHTVYNACHTSSDIMDSFYYVECIDDYATYGQLEIYTQLPCSGCSIKNSMHYIPTYHVSM